MEYTSLIILVSGIIFTCSGCINPELNYRNQSGLRHVLDMEDPRTIEKWTMEQVTPQQIWEGMASLKHIVETPEHWNLGDREQASSGLVKAFQQVAIGWPQVRADAEQDNGDPESARKRLRESARKTLWLLYKSRSNDPIVHAMWTRLLTIDPLLSQPQAKEKRGLVD